jgi:hypothetical protein
MRIGLRAAIVVAGCAAGLAAASVSIAAPGPNGRVPNPAGHSSSLVAAVVGGWSATGIVRTSAGSNEPVGERVHRLWQTFRRCGPTGCAMYITIQTADVPLTGKLTRDGLLWLVRFPDQSETCGQTPSGRVIYWNNQRRYLFRFQAGGAIATASEYNYAFAPACGYGLVTLAWQARLNASH